MKISKKMLPDLLAAILLTVLAGCGGEETSAAKASATVTPERGGFGVQEGNYQDLEVTLSPGDYTLNEVVAENETLGPDGQPFSRTLKEDTDYVKSGDTYVFLKEFLKTLSDNYPSYLVFKMDGGTDLVFTVNIVPDESGFMLDWTLSALSPPDAIVVEQADNKITMTSVLGFEELTAFYESAMELMWTAEITPQFEADWWYAAKQGDFIFTVYLSAGAEEADIILTFYLEEDQPE